VTEYRTVPDDRPGNFKVYLQKAYEREIVAKTFIKNSDPLDSQKRTLENMLLSPEVKALLENADRYEADGGIVHFKYTCRKVSDWNGCMIDFSAFFMRAV